MKFLRRGERRLLAAVGSLALVLALFPAAALGSSTSVFELVEVADGVFVHRGHQVDLESPERGDSANVGFIVGERCVAVVDSGGALATGRALRAAIVARTAVPICYVINTHVHFDHVLGNAAFVADGVEFIGHSNLAEAMAGNRDFFAERFSDELEGKTGDSVVGPTKTVSDKLTLDLGGRKLLLEAQPTAHTNADLSVLDEKTGTLWTGDLVFMGRLPILDGSLRGWLAWLETYRTKPVARIVPGHGPPSADWPAGGEAEREYLTALLSDGRKAVASGMFLEDAMESMSRDAAAPWSLNERHPRNVSRAFRELEWE
jgi:quinoprotein relay system zinc metallohydrolase 2